MGSIKKLSDVQTANWVLAADAIGTLNDLYYPSNEGKLLNRFNAESSPGNPAIVRQIDGIVPAWACYRNGGHYYFYVTGTQTTQQAILQVVAWYSSMAGRRFGSCSETALVAASRIVDDFLRVFRDPSRDDWFHLYGHSYGGAIACCLADIFGTHFGSRVTNVTFGSPRVGDEDFMSIAYPPTSSLRFMNDGDPVPYLPPHFAEAPAIFALLPPFTAQLWERFQNARPGVRLWTGPFASYDSDPLPTLDVVASSIIRWATDSRSSEMVAHLPNTYRSRILAALPSIGYDIGTPLVKAIGAAIGGVAKSYMGRAIASFESKNSSFTPAQLQLIPLVLNNTGLTTITDELSALPGTRKLLQSVSNSVSPLSTSLPGGLTIVNAVPRIYRPYVDRKRGRADVQWMGQQIAFSVPIGQAKTLAKKINSLLDRIMGLADFESEGFMTAIQLWIASGLANAPPWVVPFPPHI